MAATLLLVLAGLAGADQLAADALSGGSAARSEVVSRDARVEQRFKVAPLQSSGPVRTGSFQLVEPFELVSTKTAPQSGFVQLRNKRSGVTCAMLIVPVSPSLDPRILASTPLDPHDPIVRNDPSACAK